MSNRNLEQGSLRSIPSDVEKTRTIPFIISTYTRDRHGTVINQDNWHLENYRKNPIVSYQHTTSGNLFKDPNPDCIIAKSISIGTIGIGTEKQLVAEAKFEDSGLNPLAEKIFRKILFGTLSRTSVGFNEVGVGKYGEGKEAYKKENETYYFAGQELLEWSVVNIPSNPDAGKRKFGELPRGTMEYAKRVLGERLSLTKLDRFNASDILILFDGIDSGLKEKDPERVRLILRDIRIENERRILREKLQAEEEMKRLDQQLKAEEDTKAAYQTDLKRSRSVWD